MKNNVDGSAKNLVTALIRWDKSNHRPMPWKGEKDPYKIWLSEIILQQTRVEQGKPYYERFIEKYPTISVLAQADEREVFRLWQGLGYYSRCRNMISTAKIIMANYKGIFPSSYKEILELPGVGEYTASAIASFAFHLPYAVVDGNVQRVLARYFGIEKALNSSEGKKYFNELANKLLGKNNPAVFNQAIMDFGATVCKPQQPACRVCPLMDQCYAFSHNLVNALPVKIVKAPVKKRIFYYLVISHKNDFYIHQRIKKDIWRNLYEFLPEERNTLSNKPAAEIPFIKSFLKMHPHQAVKVSAIYRQQLTHQAVSAVFIQVKLNSPLTMPEGYLAVNRKDLNTYPFPKVILSYLQDEKLIKS